MCEWRLGREKLEVEDESGEITEVAAEEMEAPETRAIGNSSLSQENPILG
ncbi:MAG: hypothetical protein AB4372_05560 [Xenococcus sp. (in: cyanobacteria)]